MTHPDDSAPVNPLPPVVWLLFAAIVVPELTFTLGAQGLIGGKEHIAAVLSSDGKFQYCRIVEKENAFTGAVSLEKAAFDMPTPIVVVRSAAVKKWDWLPVGVTKTQEK